MARGGIEPPTRGFSVRCSTNRFPAQLREQFLDRYLGRSCRDRPPGRAPARRSRMDCFVTALLAMTGVVTPRCVLAGASPPTVRARRQRHQRWVCHSYCNCPGDRRLRYSRSIARTNRGRSIFRHICDTRCCRLWCRGRCRCRRSGVRFLAQCLLTGSAFVLACAVCPSFSSRDGRP